MKTKTLSILTPMYGGMCTGTWHQSVVQLLVALSRVGIAVSETYTFNESLISRARNRLVDEYLKNSSNEMALFIDADISFDANDILSMIELDRDIVGAPCVKKNIRWDRLRKLFKSGHPVDDESMSRVFGDFVVNWNEDGSDTQVKLDEPQEVFNIGTGLLLIKRGVFLKMREAFPDRWYTNQGDPNALPGKIFDFFRCGVDSITHRYYSEDYYFCQDAKQVGFKVWVCPWVKTGHLGSFLFRGDMPGTAALVGEV